MVTPSHDPTKACEFQPDRATFPCARAPGQSGRGGVKCCENSEKIQAYSGDHLEQKRSKMSPWPPSPPTRGGDFGSRGDPKGSGSVSGGFWKNFGNWSPGPPRWDPKYPQPRSPSISPPRLIGAEISPENQSWKSEGAWGGGGGSGGSMDITIGFATPEIPQNHGRLNLAQVDQKSLSPNWNGTPWCILRFPSLRGLPRDLWKRSKNPGAEMPRTKSVKFSRRIARACLPRASGDGTLGPELRESHWAQAQCLDWRRLWMLMG